MRWSGFGMRAAAVFLTSVVVFTAMIVIAHSLTLTGGAAPFRAAAGHDVAFGEPTGDDAEDGSTAPFSLGPLRQVGTVPSEPAPVVTAVPVPDATSADEVGTVPSTTTDSEPVTTIIATPLPSADRGPASERTPTGGGQPAAVAVPDTPVRPGSQPEPVPTPTPTPPATEPAPSESESEGFAEPQVAPEEPQPTESATAVPSDTPTMGESTAP